MGDRTFVFVAGLNRSGTSLLHKVLRSHPQISGFHDTGAIEDEGQHLQSVYPSDLAFGGAGRFGSVPETYMDEHHPLATSENARRLFSEWGRYWDTSLPYLIEKSPSNILRMRFLQKLFPTSFFVVVLRHPIAVSYATLKWCPTTLKELIEHWLVCYERFVADLPYLRRCFVLRYEEFVSRPQETMDRIYGFLGLGSSPVLEMVRPDVNEHYFQRWAKDAAEAAGPCAVAIPPSHHERVRRFGYSLAQVAELGPSDLLGTHDQDAAERWAIARAERDRSNAELALARWEQLRLSAERIALRVETRKRRSEIAALEEELASVQSACEGLRKETQEKQDTILGLETDLADARLRNEQLGIERDELRTQVGAFRREQIQFRLELEASRRKMERLKHELESSREVGRCLERELRAIRATLSMRFAAWANRTPGIRQSVRLLRWAARSVQRKDAA